MWQKALVKTAKKDLAWINERLQQGAINCNHKCLILVAEESSFGTDDENVKQNHDQAISVTRRSGFCQDEVLANELATQFFPERDEDYWASHHMKRARVSCMEWDALAKSEQIQEKCPVLVESGTQDVDRGKNFMGRGRFSHMCQMHTRVFQAWNQI